MNPLFQSFQSKVNSGNGGLNPFQSALQNLANQVSQMGMTPEQLVRQKIQNGEMTQAQFEQYRQIANRLTGKNN